MASPVEMDSVIERLSGCGRFQYTVWAIVAFVNCFPSAWHLLLEVFLYYEPEIFHCQLDANSSYELIPNVEHGYDRCNVQSIAPLSSQLIDNNTAQTFPCRQVSGVWYYNHTANVPRRTLTTDFNLVCDRESIRQLRRFIVSAGVIVGAIVFGYCSDRFGRKKILFGCLALQAIVGTIAGFVRNEFLFFALRSIVFALEQGVNLAGFILATELFPPNLRTIYGVCHEFFWAAAMMTCPLLAYFLRDWNWLQVAASAPWLLGVAFWFYVPESLHWLLAQGRKEEAEKFVRRSAKVNKIPLTEQDLSEIKSLLSIQPNGPNAAAARQTNTERHHTHLDLFRTKQMRINSICVCVLWFSNTFLYWGIAYLTDELPGDFYVNNVVQGGVEVPSCLLSIILMYKIGRRWPMIVMHLMATGIFCVQPFIPVDIVRRVLSWSAKFLINATFTILYVYGAELFPTVLRNTGVSFGSMFGRIGYLLLTPTLLLSTLTDQPDFVREKMPHMIYGLLSLIAAISVWFTPETLNRPLPETVADVEDFQQFCRRHRSRISSQDGSDWVAPNDAETRQL